MAKADEYELIGDAHDISMSSTNNPEPTRQATCGNCGTFAAMHQGYIGPNPKAGCPEFQPEGRGQFSPPLPDTELREQIHNILAGMHLSVDGKMSESDKSWYEYYERRFLALISQHDKALIATKDQQLANMRASRDEWRALAKKANKAMEG